MIASCVHSDRCGGCTYQGVDYEEQLAIKNAAVLEHLAENDVRCGEYAAISPSPNITGYRNKMEYSFGNEVKDGEMTLGLYRRKSYMSVIETDGCMIVTNDYDVIRKSVLKYMRDACHTHRHKKTREGFLRNLVIRRGEMTGELLVNLVTTDAETLDSDSFVGMLLGLNLKDEIVGIIHTTYCGKSDTVACDSMEVLHGRPYYYEEMLGLRYKVNAFAFFQTNTAAVEKMFSDAFELLPDLYSKNVFDLYCGTGAISLSIAENAGKVTGIELVPDSILAARENAEINGISNCRFLEGDALEVMDSLPERPDIVCVDPPRMGMHPKALQKLISYDLDEILYISCNPKTFSFDMAVLQNNGYRLDYLKPYDNFPFTKHTELISRIIKK